MQVSPAVPDNLSPERRRLLECLAEKNYNSITELCKDAGVSRDTYYAAVKQREFVETLFQNAKSHFYMAIPQIMQKIMQQAKQGSLFHQQFLLKMLELYEGERPNVQVAIQNNTYTMPPMEQVKEDWLAVGRAHPEWKEEL